MALQTWSCKTGTEVTTLQIRDVIDRVKGGSHLQLYSDAGYSEGTGASGFVVVENFRNSSEWAARLVEARGIIVHEALSSFQTEAMAADMAIEFASTLLGNFS